jgi:type IV pilus assembly protein PilE
MHPFAQALSHKAHVQQLAQNQSQAPRLGRSQHGVTAAQGRAQPRRAAGFTLVELLIAVAIMGILVAVAYPSYLESIRKGRRAEAISALTTLQQAQERFRANSPKYGNLNAPANAETLTNLPALTLKHYTLAVTDNTASGYTATANASGGQTADTLCATMGVRLTNGNLKYGSGTDSINWAAAEPDSGRCFPK